MNQLLTDYQVANDFTNNNPTLAAQRRALGTNGRLATAEEVSGHVGAIRHNAGMSFLERVHAEVAAANPNWRKDDEAPAATTKRRVAQPKVEPKAPAPELSDDYLNRLGIPTTLAAMSNKTPDGTEELMDEAA